MRSLLAVLAVCLAIPGCVTRRDESDGQSKGDKRRKAIENLDALSYIDGTYDVSDKSGAAALGGEPFDGYNFYSSRKETAAQLVDLAGNVLHRWKSRESGYWQHVTLFPNGDVLVLVKDKRIVKFDRNSVELWRYEARAHHDLWVHTDGKIYAITRKAVADGRLEGYPTALDSVTVLSPDGRELDRIDLLAALERSRFSMVIQQPPAIGLLRDMRANDRIDVGEFDATHVNHVEVFDGTYADLSPIYAAGNILVSYRNANTIAIIDGRSHEVVWAWGVNNLVYQHHPSLVEDGRILVFNNGTKRSGSQLLEVDPVTDRIVWAYRDKGFYSRARGSAQRLPNGNTLVTQSDTGYVFEITRGGRKVWEFRNPHRRGRTRMAIWRMVRFPRSVLSFEFNHGTVARD